MTPHLHGGRGRVLVTFAVFYLVVGYSYLAGTARTAQSLALVVDPIPLAVYGAAWMVAAAVAATAAFSREHDTAGFVVLEVVAAFWAFAYLGTWVLHLLGQLPWHGTPPDPASRGYLLAAIFGLIAAAVLFTSRLVDPQPLGAISEALREASR